MTQLSYQTLNLIQLLDALREGGTALLCLSDRGRPYATPAAFQLEMRGVQPVLHMALGSEGRRARILQENPQVCVSVLRPACAWTDSILLEGEATLVPAPGGTALLLAPTSVCGRRYFISP